MSKKAHIFLITFLISLTALSQQLVINEVSQGPSGNKEYVELVVVGSPTCNGIPTMDLRGYYIDDNNGTFAPGAGTGIAPGCVRFQNIPFWSAIPYGTIIVIHNDADVNASVPANDISMVDGNCLLVIPVSNNTLLERHTTLPVAGTPAYPVAGFVAGGNWNQISMANADDSFQTRDASGALVHAVSWGNNTTSNIIYFAGAAGGFVMLNANSTNTNPATLSNWTKIAVAGNETPGAPNNAANAAWISSMNNGCVVIQPFGATTASANPGCTCNGLASISPTGAIAPYTYTWAPSGGNASSASALCAGIYTVTTKSSNNCTLTATYTLTSSGALTTATAATQPACFGSTGSATITPSGVAGPFTYTWTPSVSSGSTASGLTAGNYTVSVGAGGCISTKTITISSPPAAITINTSVTQPACFGSTGSGTVNASGGPTNAYVYTWNPSASTGSIASGLGAGAQTITVNSGVCSNTAVINIVVPSSLTIVASTTSVMCTGASNGSGTVTVTGGAGGYSYLWSSGFTSSVVSGQAAGNLTVTVTDANGCSGTKTLNIAQPASALTTATAVTNILCNGGTTGAATITANGGTTPYSYLWSSGATSSVVSALPAGVLSVTVTDANGCTSTKTVSISQPASALSTNTSVINVLCNGAATGAATINAVGGTTPYNYLWSSGSTSSVVSSQLASILTVTVTDANGCSSTKTVNIIQPSVLTTAIAGASIACNGNPTGTATITATGGAGGYSYLWSSGLTTSVVTGQAAGNLTVTVSDANGCISTKTINIAQPTTALTSNTVVTNVLCNGATTGAASITANGGTSPYNYLWSSGATSSVVSGQSAGILTVTVTDANGCTSTKTVTISQPASALTTNTFVTNVLCHGASTGAASVTANGGTTPYNYLWSSGATSSFVTGQLAGVLIVTVTDANGCASSQNVTISQPAAALSIAITSTNAACGLANGSASATVNGGTSGYSYTWSPTGGNSSLASGLFIGNYSVTVIDANGCLAIQTVTITQPNSMTVTINSTSVTCNGGNNGTAIANVIGVTGPYTYTWNPSPGSGQGTSNVSGLSAQIYTLSVTDNVGCITLTNVAISQPIVALAGVTSATNVSCFGGANGSASVSASGGTTGYSYTWTPSGISAAFASGLTAGNYSVTIADANNCTFTVNIIISQPISALVGVISTTNVLCFGGSTGATSVSASGGTSGYNYSWSPSGGIGALASGLVAGNYSVTITDANNCTFSISTTITQPPAALNIVTSTTNASCGLANGSASASVSGGTGVYSYTWSPAGGNLALTSGISVGNYTVTVQDANNCFASQTATVIQPNSMTVTLNSSSITCNGGSNGTAIANVVGSVGPYTYTWNPTPGGGQNTSNASGLSAQIYTLTVTDNLGCNTHTSISILEPTGLSAVISTTAVNCFGNSTGVVSVSTSGGNAGYTYTWAPSGGNGSIASGLVAGNYTVTITDANNCNITTSASVTQPANSLSATINATNVLCFGGNSGSASLNTNGGTATYNYTWAPTGGNLSIASNLSAGTYTAFITDSRNCTFSITTSIAQPTANLTAAINNNSISCFGLTSGSASVSPNGGTGAYTFTWLPTGGNNSTAAGLGAGSYTAIINDANNCSFSVSTTISQGNPITVNVNPIQICNGQNGTLNGTINGGEGPYTYIWNGTTALNPFSVSPSATTVYSLSVVDNKGCVSNVDTALVMVSAPLSLNISPSKTICTNASATLFANGSGGLGNYQYHWMPLNTNGQTIVISPAGTSVYSVTVSDNCSQPVTLTTTITVESILSSTLLASNFTGCSPLCVDFNNSVFNSSANILTSSWNFGDGSITTGLQNTHCFTKPGTFSVTNTYATLAGCINTVTLSNVITVSATPIADFYVSNPQFTYFTPDVLFQNISLNATSYFWDFSGIGTSTLTQPSFSFYEPGKYLIALIAKNGSCSDTILKTIDCLPEFTFYAPNAFTPNADDLNERFLPLGEGWVKDTYVLRIFDRWGEQIFHTAEWNLGWNGKKGGVGNIVKDDVYVWKVSLKDIFGKQHEYIGHIEVLK